MEMVALVAFVLHVVAWMVLPDGRRESSAAVRTTVGTAPAKA